MNQHQRDRKNFQTILNYIFVYFLYFIYRFPGRIFDVSDADLNSVKTVKAMRVLFDNYEIDSGKQPKPVTYETMHEIDNFINAVLDTTVMEILMDFLKKKSKKKCNIFY